MARRAVILAGGKGSRLGPYTTVLPKPLLPVGDRAILDVVVHQLRDCGFTDLTLAVGYLAHLVRAVMGDGSTPRRQHRLPRGGPSRSAPSARWRRIDGLDDTFLVDERRRADRARLRAPRRRPPRGRQHAHDRLPPPRRAHRVRRPPPRRRGRRDARVTGFEEKPEIPYIGQHGRLRARAARARVHRAGRVPRPARPRAAAARGRRSRSAPTSTTGTGSTSGATRTTRRRSSSSSS